MLLFIKLSLSLLSFSTFKKLFSRISKNNLQQTYSEKYISQLVWSIEGIATNIPLGFMCLPQALTAKYFLRKDLSIELIIGVQKENADIIAHAWVEHNGSFIIGDTPFINYTPIWKWG
jgi:enhancing lycopene biosynthesis protein 2